MIDRDDVIALATGPAAFAAFLTHLSSLIAMPSVSRDPSAASAIRAYLHDLLAPDLTALGFTVTLLENPSALELPFLLAERIEDTQAPTVLIYGHGDVVEGMDTEWAPGLHPFRARVDEDHLYGRGSADNKGQHAIALAALRTVIHARGRLGFNCKVLIEMGEERGSPGLEALFRDHPARLWADVLIASDGPRLNANRPTLFLGARGSLRFDLTIALREKASHSGHWGGLLRDPAIDLAHAISAMSDLSGALLVPEWRPNSLTPDIRARIADCGLGDVAGETDADWGEPGLSPAEKVFGWNSLTVLALDLGNPNAPMAAIAPAARARCQLRFVVGTDADDIVPALRRRLDAMGLTRVAVTPVDGSLSPATRLDPSDHWVAFAAGSIARTTGAPPDILPNIGGSIPNHVFANVARLPTLWIPHSYRGCQQHAVDEHLPLAIAREGLAVMTGLFWDLAVQY